MGFRVLHPEEENGLLKHATPAIQDIVLYALNTGCRIGEIFSLRWQSVDFEKGLINVFAGKTQKVRVVQINKPVRRILDFWALGRKNEYVFYNQKTGELFVDLARFRALCSENEATKVCAQTGIRIAQSAYHARMFKTCITEHRNGEHRQNFSDRCYACHFKRLHGRST